jgi:uncharacterized surface protein with fasciclin (FAS1) repeats
LLWINFHFSTNPTNSKYLSNPRTKAHRLCYYSNQLNEIMKKYFLSLTMVAALSGVLTACSDNSSETSDTTDTTTNTTATTNDMPANITETGVMVGGSNMVPSKNIVENAANSSDHTTLVAAVQAAGLAETLSGTGPFTVFAPTNAAFNKLPTGTVDNLVKPENKEQLTKILTYHVVPGALRAADLKDGQKLKTVQGQELTVKIVNGTVTIGGATVSIADVISSNGVTHVIDGVIMPK